MEGVKMMEQLFKGVYKNKRVLVTGHTGFKGSWLSAWLLSLGANVAGYSLYIPSRPSHFELLDLEKKVRHSIGDIRDLEKFKKVVFEFRPDVIFHLAAQPITRKSYDVPQETMITNFGGTVNVLETLRCSDFVKVAVMITSDKCYQNVEWFWGYRENDRLGGDDPYSASKACAEIACRSYFRSFFENKDATKIVTVRAGNVIGGADWAPDRIVPDCVRAFSAKKELLIRNADSTRPWQYVLEPLSGYLWLGAKLLSNDKRLAGEAFNFGPLPEVNRTVKELILEFIKTWDGKWKIEDGDSCAKKECTLLKLNCDKADFLLDWHAVLSFERSISMTAKWYKKYYARKPDCMYDYSLGQIAEYASLAKESKMRWAMHSDL